MSEDRRVERVRGLLFSDEPAAPPRMVHVPANAITRRALLRTDEVEAALQALLPESTDGYGFYAPVRRLNLRPNNGAAVLSARLGHVNRHWLASLRGRVLVLGFNVSLDDCDLPAEVVQLAVQAGLLKDNLSGS